MNPRRRPRTIPHLRGSAWYRSILKGLRPSAQGCEERATLGYDSEVNSTATRLWPCVTRIAQSQTDFSVSQSNLEQVKQYIAGQEEHHRKIGFQDELRALLRKHEIEWDEKYVWD